MGRRRAAAILAALMLCSQAVIWAGDSHRKAGLAVPAAATAPAAASPTAEPVKPWIHHKMDPDVRARLEAGFDLAVERVRDLEACAELFSRLGTDGIEVLKTGLYLPVPTYHHEIVLCGRDPAANSLGAKHLAYAKVGGAPTWICRQFSLVTTKTAAVAVIHEALHHAGLPERPHDRLAMSSQEITEMVENSCGFRPGSPASPGRFHATFGPGVP